MTAPAQAQTFDAAGRPHATVTLRDGGVALARLDAAARRSDGQVVLRLTLTARARLGAAGRYVLRAGACRRANTGHVTCPPSFARTVALSTRRTTILVANARLRMSSGPRRAALVSLTPAGARPPARRGARSAVASLLLPDRAWRSYPGRRFGLRAYRPWEGGGGPIDVRTVTADAAQVGPATLAAVLGWSLRSTVAADVTTIVSACGGRAACPEETTTRTVAPGATSHLAIRPALERSRPGYWSFVARSGDGVLFDATMPWPL